MDEEELVDVACSVITDYVRTHPKAADTPEGVAQWWMSKAQGFSPAVVEAALEKLVAEGVMVRHQRAGTVVYTALVSGK